MKKRTVVFWLAILVILTPYLGVPIQYKEYALIIIGVFIALLSIPLNRGHKDRRSSDIAFKENRDQLLDKQPS